MERRHLFIPNKTISRLKKEAEKIGIKVSELIRRILDAWLEKKDA
jgi:hypothetical protein